MLEKQQSLLNPLVFSPDKEAGSLDFLLFHPLESMT